MNVPAPTTSRTTAIRNSASVKPMPMPMPSRIESNTLCLLANISARPRMMQLTTMSGRKMPSAEYKSGTYACSSNSAMVTNPAITTM